MPNSLASYLRDQVSRSTRTKGEEYLALGRVTRVKVDGETLHATVQGARFYDVWLTLDQRRVTVRCTCPYFTDTATVCKHIWATILRADEERAFVVSGRLVLHVDVSEYDFVDDL